jgi:hypothetical protein
MLRGADFQLASIQCGIFVEEAMPSHAALLAWLLERWSDRFDGGPTVLPAPEPGDTPLIALQSKDLRSRLQTVPGRLDVYAVRQHREEPLSFAGSLEWMEEVASAFVERFSPGVGRLALMAVRVLPMSSPATEISQHFCNEKILADPIRRTENFELHSHKVFLLRRDIGPKVNSWMRCKSGTATYRLPPPPISEPVVVVEQDINTLAEESATRRFAASEVSPFYRDVAAAMDVVLAKYFPSEANGA